MISRRDELANLLADMTRRLGRQIEGHLHERSRTPQKRLHSWMKISGQRRTTRSGRLRHGRCISGELKN